MSQLNLLAGRLLKAEGPRPAPPGVGLTAVTKIYIALICLVGLLVAIQPPDLPEHDSAGLFVFLVLGAAAQLTTIRFYKDASVSLAMAMALATILVFGPMYAVWVNLASGLVHYWTQIRPKKRPLYRSAVTTSALVITAWVSGWTYVTLGGQVGPHSDYFASLLPTVLAGLVYYAVNTTLITGAMALEQRKGFWALLQVNYQWVTVNVASLTPLAFGMALLYQKIGFAGLIIYLIPIVMARYSFQLYARSAEDVQKANEELQRANERLNIMHDVSRSFVGSLHMDETLNRVLAATQLMGFPAGFVAGRVGETARPTLQWRVAEPIFEQWLLTRPDEPVETSIGDIVSSVTREIWFAEGEPHVLSLSDYRKSTAAESGSLPSLTLVPLIVRGQTWGVIGVGSTNPPSPIEMKELLIFRSMAVSALEMVLAHEQTERDSWIDALTGLYNQRYFQDALQRELQEAARRHDFLSLLMLDMNKFKEFNDLYGHLVGDQALQTVGQILKEASRAEDMACRYGGDEFTILLPHTDRARAMEVAARIDRAVQAHTFQARETSDFGIKQIKTLSFQVSIGVASFPEVAQTRAGLIEKADRACYRAKALGGGVVGSPGPASEEEAAMGHSIRLQLIK